jgi:SAM-dependent methyltransferase
MKTLVFDFDDFLKLFKFNKTISYDDFCQQLSVLNISDKTGTFAVRSGIDEFIERVAKKDNRKSRLDTYKKQLYKMLVEEPEVALREWFRRYGELPNDLNYYFQIPNGSILKEDTFQGIKNSKYGRVCKNINFDKFYNTKKLYSNDSEYTFGLLKAMFEDFKIRNSLAGPAFFDHICSVKDGDYGRVWVDFMIGANRASIFNPATYKGIVDELLSGETLFAPVMGWNAYQFGFYGSNFKHFVATDVIPEVVNNGHKLHDAWQAYRDQSVFDIPDKTVDLYCCPSEQLQSKHEFIDRYRNKVDAVLFSPPYYDLEIYDSDDQSFTNYPDYQDWLTHYWEATVKTAAEVLKPGGRFAFVISNYRNKNKQEVSISQDMKSIVDRHLSYVDRYKVQWSAISSGRQAKKMKNGNFEDLWLFEKSL